MCYTRELQYKECQMNSNKVLSVFAEPLCVKVQPPRMMLREVYTQCLGIGIQHAICCTTCLPDMEMEVWSQPRTSWPEMVDKHLASSVNNFTVDRLAGIACQGFTILSLSPVYMAQLSKKCTVVITDMDKPRLAVLLTHLTTA